MPALWTHVCIPGSTDWSMDSVAYLDRVRFLLTPGLLLIR